MRVKPPSSAEVKNDRAIRYLHFSIRLRGVVLNCVRDNFDFRFVFQRRRVYNIQRFKDLISSK
jgi:hypothetical protein